MSRAMLAGSTALALSLGSACAKKKAEPLRPPVRVAAASDLALAFPEIGAAFERRTGEKVTFSFGATGHLAKQIAEGAPFDAFAAADERFVDDVIAAGACDAGSKVRYARGHLVMLSAAGVVPPTTIDALAHPRYRTIAIANPEHAPYGRAANQALERAGVWGAVAPRIVYGQNVQQAVFYAESGNADVAIVSSSLGRGDAGITTAVPPHLHDPIDQAMVSCTRGEAAEAGRRFVAFVRSDEGQAILTRFGFGTPAE